MLIFRKKITFAVQYLVIVAQLVRVSVCGSEGRGFKSRLSPKKKVLLSKTFFYVYTFLIKHD